MHGVVFDQWTCAFARDGDLGLSTKRGESRLGTSLFGLGLTPRRSGVHAGVCCLRPVGTCPYPRLRSAAGHKEGRGWVKGALCAYK